MPRLEGIVHNYLQSLFDCLRQQFRFHPVNYDHCRVKVVYGKYLCMEVYFTSPIPFGYHFLTAPDTFEVQHLGQMLYLTFTVPHIRFFLNDTLFHQSVTICYNANYNTKKLPDGDIFLL